MGQFIINGGKTLKGEISVSGSKNAALPIIFASMLIEGETRIYNLPEIGDVDIAFDILRAYGAKIYKSKGEACIDASDLKYTVPDESLVSKIRASSYLLGASLARFGRAQIQRFGGCNFDNRPIDMHLYAAAMLGAEISDNNIYSNGLCAADIFFDKISVGATVNAIIMAVSAKGMSRIFGYAKEPHVISLVDFFRSAGVRIELTDACILVFGAIPYSASVNIIPDMIEAGTYVALSLLLDSEIKINGARFSELESFLLPLVKSGAIIEYDDNSIITSSKIDEQMNIITSPYPEYPTDLHPQTVPLIAVSCGGSVTERVWQNRFGYLSELSKFGVRYEICGNTVNIRKSALTPARAVSPDLRGGASLLLAALYANGESVIENVEIIKRGYGNIVEKLKALGADIKEL